MRLWKRATGALKDQNSLFLASLARRTAFRNPKIEAAVIKATNHDEYPVDQRYVERVHEWIRLSPKHYLKPILWAITTRVEKTRSWEVALKALTLTHRVLFPRAAGNPVSVIGRLPFDLSGFTDRRARAWAQNAFVRSYFAFLDKKSIVPLQNPQGKNGEKTKIPSFSVSQDLNALRNLQGLLDILLQVKPQPELTTAPLISEAMDMIVVEVYDIYGQICDAIARVLLRIYMAGKTDAKLALQVVRKATAQSEALTSYFEYCAEIGLITIFDCPKVKRIPEEDIRELEDIIKGNSTSNLNNNKAIKEESGLKTVITDNWETFDNNEDQMAVLNNNNNVHAAACHQDLPDLISFSNLVWV